MKSNRAKTDWVDGWKTAFRHMKDTIMNASQNGDDLYTICLKMDELEKKAISYYPLVKACVSLSDSNKDEPRTDEEPNLSIEH